LDAQREVYVQRMREVTRDRTNGDVVDRLAGDFELVHLEADLKWVELAGQRLDRLAKELNTTRQDKTGQSS
jgi:hypothetical protein